MSGHRFPPLLDPGALPGRVLVASAHPDDEVLGCGGMLAFHAGRGDAVRVLQLSDGSGGDPKALFGDVAKLRREEIAEALGVLGISDLVELAFPDGSLAAAPGLAERLEREIAAFAPRLLYALAPTELHADHRAAFAAVARALAPAADFRVHLFGVNAFPPANALYDVTAWMEKKLEAVRRFRSQMRYHDLVEKVKAVNRAGTVNVDLPEVRFVESYCVARAPALPAIAAAAADLEDAVDASAPDPL